MLDRIPPRLDTITMERLLLRRARHVVEPARCLLATKSSLLFPNRHRHYHLDHYHCRCYHSPDSMPKHIQLFVTFSCVPCGRRAVRYVFSFSCSFSSNAFLVSPYRLPLSRLHSFNLLCLFVCVHYC